MLTQVRWLLQSKIAIRAAEELIFFCSLAPGISWAERLLNEVWLDPFPKHLMFIMTLFTVLSWFTDPVMEAVAGTTRAL